ncbi:MAG: hypothetical protein ACMXYF_03340 [Candidatus Woesearchaeota archaeon]
MPSIAPCTIQAAAIYNGNETPTFLRKDRLRKETGFPKNVRANLQQQVPDECLFSNYRTINRL